MDRPLSPEKEQRVALLGRIARSSYFANAESLRRILDYLAERTLDDESVTLKEYDIAISAIRRPESFDPKLDPIVRVSMSSIRERLRAYFQNEGKREPWVLSIPKGQYRLHFGEPGLQERAPERQESSALAEFWAPYLAQSAPALLVYTEVLFYRDDRGNFVRNIYVNSPADAGALQARFPETGGMALTPSFHFFSAGEMHALLSVSRALNGLGCAVDTRNGRFSNWRDFQGVNSILLGSCRTNPFIKSLLAGMPLSMDDSSIFEAGAGNREGRRWKGLRFQEGLLERVEEYALITRRPGPAEGTMVTLIAANHGRAIEAGGAFISHEDGCREILSRLGPTGMAQSFQILLGVDLLDFDEEIVGVRYLEHRFC